MSDDRTRANDKRYAKRIARWARMPCALPREMEVEHRSHIERLVFAGLREGRRLEARRLARLRRRAAKR